MEDNAGFNAQAPTCAQISSSDSDGPTQHIDLAGAGNGVFACYVKNVRSIQTETCFEEMTCELESMEWDAVLVNETWRGEKEEIIELASGDVWFGSGGKLGKHGVGVLQRKVWRFRKFTAISERLCLLEVDVAERKLSIIVVYMPHDGYKDLFVESLYIQISELMKSARAKKHIIILGGDWNAEVQSTQCSSMTSAVGRFANISGNRRGKWMANWAAKEGMVIANTKFKKR